MDEEAAGAYISGSDRVVAPDWSREAEEEFDRLEAEAEYLSSLPDLDSLLEDEAAEDKTWQENLR